MSVDLDRIAEKFRIEPVLIDRLHRRIRLPEGKDREAHQRVELLCLAVVTRNLHHTLSTWIRWDRTPIDDAIDEASRRSPQWTRFDWDCDAEGHDGWQPTPGTRVRIFTRGREFIGYARVVHFDQPADYQRRPSTAQYRFELPIPEWATIPATNKANIGRVLPA